MKTFLGILAIIPVFLLVISCSGELTGPTDGNNYQVETVLVKYLEGGSARIDLILTRNDTLYKKANIKLGNISLDTGQTGYFKVFTPAQIETGKSYVVNISDGTSLSVNLSITIPGAFSINKPSLRNFIGNAVAVDWTVSVNNDGYILATEPPQGPVVYDGYEAYEASTAGAIPPEAFMINVDDRILGTHKIHVASYTGAPTDLGSLPFGIPVANNPDDNVTIGRISGRTAGIVVAVPDSIIVATQ